MLRTPGARRLAVLVAIVHRLRTVDLGKARSGKLRIVVGQNKPVRIEGVAVVTDVS